MCRRKKYPSLCLDKKVITVSPNLLYAYLMTVAMGLHGLLIERQAAEIRQNLKTLTGSLTDFATTFDVLGKHLRNAYSQYDDGQKRLDRLGLQLTQFQQTPRLDDPPAVPPNA